jgi:DNA-directed RNA polymerase subunit M/transcription elongation factor TFIIS
MNNNELDIHCPECGSSKVVEILYGFRSPDAPPIDRTKYVLGGCSLSFENTMCDSCGHTWQIDQHGIAD